MEPNVATQLNPEGQEGLEPVGGAEAVIEPVVEEPLYAGRFKTPEELVEHYKLSSQEGVRLAGENKRLLAILQQVQGQVTGKSPGAQPKSGYDDFFDKDTGEAVAWHIKKYITEFATSQKSQASYERQVADIWEGTKKDFPDVSNPQSELYQLADRILFDNGLASRDAEGLLQLATPWAYRIAVETAYSQLSRKAPERAAAGLKKGQATAVSGRATGFTPQGKLTPEAYNKLSDDDKDKYDAWQLGQGQR